MKTLFNKAAYYSHECYHTKELENEFRHPRETLKSLCYCYIPKHFKNMFYISFWILNWNFSFASVWQILQHPSSQGLFQYFSSFYASLHAYNVHTALCNALSNSLQYDSWAQSSHTHRATGWLALCTGGKLDRISSSFLKRQRKNGIYYRAEAVFSGYTAAD